MTVKIRWSDGGEELRDVHKSPKGGLRKVIYLYPPMPLRAFAEDEERGPVEAVRFELYYREGWPTYIEIAEPKS